MLAQIMFIFFLSACWSVTYLHMPVKHSMHTYTVASNTACIPLHTMEVLQPEWKLSSSKQEQ